jgi:hypothetical protein
MRALAILAVIFLAALSSGCATARKAPGGCVNLRCALFGERTEEELLYCAPEPCPASPGVRQ